MTNMLRAVLAIQEAGVIHEDVFERNFMITGEKEHPRVVMLDFGDAYSTSDPIAIEDSSRDRSHAFAILHGALGWERAHELVKDLKRRRKREGYGAFERAFWKEMLEICISFNLEP